MAMFVSRLSRDVQSLPEAYVFPPDKRPGELAAPEFNNPIIDFSKPVDETIPKILRAGQEFGFFQVHFSTFFFFLKMENNPLIWKY